MLENNPDHAYGASQADAYQMLVYGARYQEAGEKLWLLYPKTALGPLKDVTIDYPQGLSLVILQMVL